MALRRLEIRSRHRRAKELGNGRKAYAVRSERVFCLARGVAGKHFNCRIGFRNLPRGDNCAVLWVGFGFGGYGIILHDIRYTLRRSHLARLARCDRVWRGRFS
jgi:hypothetical protein